ncbi:MAG: succinate--CoA ligase subunit alpha [Candidatus Hodarchaeales archaeon]|jgi:succinyl-CoA synthetase alpha subunit
MAILLDSLTKVIVQGITGYQGLFHSKMMRNYGTNIVGGVTPGKGGSKVEGFSVYDSVVEAVDITKATASILFVPARFVRSAAFEAIDSGVSLLVVITEGVPVRDTMAIVHRARKAETVVIGPNCPGIITPGQAKMGIIPGSIVTPGNIGVVSRSGTLTYEVMQNLTNAGMGQTSCIGIGGDPIKGFNFIEALTHFQNDSETEKIILIGEIGGADEEKAAEYIKQKITKPVVSFIAGKTAKEGKTMGHAGAIVQGNVGTAKGKIDALESVGVKVASKISEIPNLLK